MRLGASVTARLGVLQSLLHQSVSVLFFVFASGCWEKEGVHFPFSGGRGDYTGPVEELSNSGTHTAPHRTAPHCLAAVCCRLGLTDLTHGMTLAGQGNGGQDCADYGHRKSVGGPWDDP